MPSQIEVISGISAGSSYWIDRPVMRIGNDPTTDVCLPCAELAGYAATLEYRDGQYRIYNRSGTELTLDGKPLAANAVANWSSGQVLQITSDVSLLFKSEGDPAPAERPTSAYLEDYEEEDAEAASETEEEVVEDEEEAAAKKKKAMMQWAVIVFCCLACALLLMKKRSRSDAPDAPRFDRVIEASLASDEISRFVVERLRHAQSAVLRGDLEAASQRYERLRDQLIYLQETSEDDPSEAQKELLEFVEHQLQELNDSGGLFGF